MDLANEFDRMMRDVRRDEADRQSALHELSKATREAIRDAFRDTPRVQAWRREDA